MPVRFNSFIPDREEDLQTKLLSNIVSKYTQNADDLFVSDDKTKIHMTSFFKDVHTGERIGKVVITLLVNETEKVTEIVDIDITLLSNNKTQLHFDSKLTESSEANEYYVVYDLNEERYFEIETVNRYSVKEDEIEGTNQEVYLSCFPFQLEIFDTMEDLDKRFGFSGHEIDIPGVGKKKFGLSADMIAVGSVIAETSGPCAFIIGKIANYRDVEVDMADLILKFKIIDLETAIGIIPVAVHEENFDLSRIGKDKYVCTFANVKADFRI